MSKKVDLDPAAWQERHSPTEAVETRVTAERKIVRTRRRKADARIFDGLIEDQQQAMVEINDAFNDITGHVGASIMMYEEHIPGTGDRHHRRDILRRCYIEWAELGIRGKFSHAAALDIIAFGKGLREVEVERRRRQGGWAKGNLVDALDVWCEVRGWKLR